MSDITELAQKRNAAISRLSRVFEPGHSSQTELDALSFAVDVMNELVEALEKAQQHIARQEQILLNQDESLSIRRGELEAAQQERESWRTSFDNERFRADKLKAHIDDIEPVRAAAEKLVRCKGRYHSEQNYRALAALFGVTTPDLPPLDSESRTVTVNLPKRSVGEVMHMSGFSRDYAEGWCAGNDNAIHHICNTPGIKWEAE